MTQFSDFPQNLLDRIKAAQHPPSRDPTARYVFRIVHMNRDDRDLTEEVDSEDEMDSEDEDSIDNETHRTYDTLEQANNAALSFFASAYREYCDQEEDMSNWYEEGTSEERLNEVVWSFNENGQLSLCAYNEEGFECEVHVSASKVA